MTLETIEFIKAIVIIMSFPFTVVGVFLVFKNMENQYKWNKMNKAFEYSLTEDPKFINILQTLDGKFGINHAMKKSINPIDIDITLESDTIDLNPNLSAEQVKIRNYVQIILARLENMAIAIEHEIVEEEICRHLLESRVVNLYTAFEEYIKILRIRRNAPKLYINLQNLAETWGAKKDESSNKY